MATRLVLGSRTGTVGAEPGLLGPVGDHLGIAEAPEGWQIDDHTIRRMAPVDLEPRPWIEVLLDIHTSVLAGQAPLVVAYGNLPAHDNGEMVLLLSLGPTAARGRAARRKAGDAQGCGGSARLPPGRGAGRRRSG
jgi:hypothetical protein